MNLKQLVRSVLRPIARPVLDAIADWVAAKNAETVEEKVRFELHVLAALRSLGAGGDHRVLPPYDSARPQTNPKTIKIGFFGNIANNAYNLTKCLRRLGYDAELVVEDGFFETFPLSRPFWEDVEAECDTYDEGLRYEDRWRQPEFVRRVAFDGEMQARFQSRYSAVPEVQALYKDAFGAELSSDRALVLAQYMGHWPYLLAMQRYDVVQLSGAAISMGALCPKPYVIYPTGGDLFISPFEDTVFGLLMRSGYRHAGHLLLGEASFFGYCDRLMLSAPRTFAPFMIDTEIYAPGRNDDVRAQWMKRAPGGTRFILNVCRQSWEWKGNDRLIRAFHDLLKDPQYQEWRLVLMQWGTDVEKTRQLIADLGLEAKVLWEKLSSKPLLRKRQQAADLVADQFVMSGYGTSVLESMAAGKAVVMRPPGADSQTHLKEQPPFLGAVQPEEICAQLRRAHDDHVREGIGKDSCAWIHAQHGYRSVFKAYVDAYESVRRHAS